MRSRPWHRSRWSGDLAGCRGSRSAAYALVTIGAYLATGPYILLGWVAKGIEVAIVGLIGVDLLSTYGSPSGVVRAAAASIRAMPARSNPLRG